MTRILLLGPLSIASLSLAAGGLDFCLNHARGEISIAPVGAPPVEVIAVGEMRTVMQKGDLSAAIDLQKLSKTKHVYALGPVEGLRGEITIWDGQPSIARISDGKIQISEKFDVRACFLVYSQVQSWHETPIPDEVQTLEQLEAFVAAAAKRLQIDTDRPFPFAVRGKIAKVSFHIVNKTDNLPHNREQHDRIKVHFTSENVPGRLIAFYSNRHHGVFTHHGVNTHVHFISDDRKQSGHVESLRIGAGAKLLLPRT